MCAKVVAGYSYRFESTPAKAGVFYCPHNPAKAGFFIAQINVTFVTFMDTVSLSRRPEQTA